MFSFDLIICVGVLIMEIFLQRELQTCTVRALGSRSGGCISDGQSYELDDGKKVFVKHNQDDKVLNRPHPHHQLYIIG